MDSWHLLATAIGLALVFEGLLPFVSPSRWRHMFEQLLRMTDGQIRFLGLSSMALGLLMAWLFS